MNPPSVPDLRGLRFRVTTMLEGFEIAGASQEW
jgi:hypothetical protein